MKKVKYFLLVSIILNVAALFYILNLPVVNEDIIVTKKKNSFRKKPKSTYFMGKDLIFEQLGEIENKKAIVFLGDSHTEHFYLQEFLGNKNLKNRGISGDRLRGILKRLEPIITIHPAKIFIQAGINDFGTGGNVDTVMSQYRRMIEIFKNQLPETKLYVQSVFPVENKLESTYCNPKVNRQVVNMNAQLKAEAEKLGYTFIDIYSELAVDQKLNPNFSFDGIHLTAEGYKVWTKIVAPYVVD